MPSASKMASLRTLIAQLFEEQSAVPDELAESMDMQLLRYHLERISGEGDNAGRRGLRNDLTRATDDEIQVVMEVDGDWIDAGDGVWRARPLVASAAGAAGAAHLDSLRQVAAAPVVAERDLQYASQLLRDPAYHQVGIQRKVHQLSKLVVAALIREERRATPRGADPAAWPGQAMPDDAAYLPYASALEAHHVGRVDGGTWTFLPEKPPDNVKVDVAAKCTPSAGGASTFHLVRASVSRHGNAKEDTRQAVAFAADAHAVLCFVIEQSKGANGRLRAIIDQLVPIIRAEESGWESAQLGLHRAQHRVSEGAIARSRNMIRADLDLLEAAMEQYALSVLTWLDGDPEPPSLDSVLAVPRQSLQSVLAHVLRAALPYGDRAASSGVPTNGPEGGNGDESDEGDEDDEQDEDPEDEGDYDGGGACDRRLWTRARKELLQVRPLGWLLRVGSTRRLPYWTFLQTLTCWFFSAGANTNYMQYNRGTRQFSHHSRVNAFLELRAKRVAHRLAQGPPALVGAPDRSHVLTWLDNHLKYINLSNERRDRSNDSEQHGVVFGYTNPRGEAARVPEHLPVSGWHPLQAGTLLSQTRARYVCVDDDPDWHGVTVAELCVGAHLCNRWYRQLPRSALSLRWAGPFETRGELAAEAPWLVSQGGRTPLTLVEEGSFDSMIQSSAELQHILRVQREQHAIRGRRHHTLVPPIAFRWPEVSVARNGRLSAPYWSTTCLGWAARSRFTNPTLWTADGKWHEVDRRFGEFQSGINECSTNGNYIAHQRLQRLVNPRAPAIDDSSSSHSDAVAGLLSVGGQGPSVATRSTAATSTSAPPKPRPAAATAASRPITYSSSQYSDGATDKLLLSLIQSLETQVFAKEFHREEDIKFVLDSLRELWTIDLQGGDLHFVFHITLMALTGGWDYAALRAEKDTFGRTNFEPTKAAQAWRAKVTLLSEHATAWYTDAVGAFHDAAHVPSSVFPKDNDTTKSFDYDAYGRAFDAFIVANSAVDAEARKQAVLVRQVVRPLLLLLQAQHWAEFEVQHVLRKGFVPALVDSGHDNYARLMPTLELNFHLRSPMVNALNSTHIQHSVSGIPGCGFSGDHLQEDHVHLLNSIAPGTVRPKEYAKRMSVRSLNIGMRRWLLRSLAKRDWAGLSTPSTNSSAPSSVAIEVGLLARAMQRARINRPDENRTVLRRDGLGNFLRATIVTVSTESTAAVEAAACFGYVRAGEQPILVSPNVLIAGRLQLGDDMPEGAILLGMTISPTATTTGGGGDFCVVGDKATGFLWMKSGAPETLSAIQAKLVSADVRYLQLSAWPTDASPLGLRVDWDHRQPRDRGGAHVLPAHSVIVAIGTQTISDLLAPPKGSTRAPMALAAVVTDVTVALGQGKPLLQYARPLSIHTLCADALDVASPDLAVSPRQSGGRWLWLFHPKLKPSSTETTGFPKSRVPTQVESLVIASEAAPAEPMAEGDARQTTTEVCRMCHLPAGACCKPGEDGHLDVSVAHCVPCSGKQATKRPELRKGCTRCGAATPKGSRTPHWPAESLKPASPPEVHALGGLPFNWMALRESGGDAPHANVSADDAEDAERDLRVCEIMHAADAKQGFASDPVLPGGKPGRPGREASGVKVTDSMLNGTLAPPSQNHLLPPVANLITEIGAGVEASRFCRELATGELPLSAALSHAVTASSATDADSTAGANSAESSASREARKQETKAMREKLNRARISAEKAKQRYEAIKAMITNEFVVVRGRAGVQKSAGVACGGKADELARDTRLAELAAAKKALEKAAKQVNDVRERAFDSVVSSRVRASGAGPSQGSSQATNGPAMPMEVSSDCDSD